MNRIIKYWMLLMVILSVNVFALDTNDPFRMEWDATFDSAFIAADTIDVTVSIYDQTNSLMTGLKPELSISPLNSARIVNRQVMTDNGDGTYTIANVDLSGAPDEYIEAEVRVPVGNQNPRSRLTFFHGASIGPDADGWKMVIVSPTTSEFTSLDSIEFIAKLYNDSGKVWSGQVVEIDISHIQTGVRPVNAVVMTDNNDGSYTFKLPGGTLAGGNDYDVVVDAANLANNSARDFLVIEINAGPVPILVNGPGTTLDRRIPLLWHPVSGASVYTIQIDTIGDFNNTYITSPTADTFYQPLLDLPVGTIYWRVESNANPGSFSMVDSFIIQDATIPQIISSIPSPTQQKKPTFMWHSVPGGKYLYN